MLLNASRDSSMYALDMYISSTLETGFSVHSSDITIFLLDYWEQRVAKMPLRLVSLYTA